MRRSVQSCHAKAFLNVAKEEATSFHGGTQAAPSEFFTTLSRFNKGQKRWQSTSTSTSQPSKLNVGEIQKRLSRVAVNTKNSSNSIKSSVFNVLPNQMKQVIQSAKQPGNVQKVLKLQLEAFWQRYSRVILVVLGVFLVYSLWRTLFYFASVFFRFSESMADLGFLALAAAMASFAFLYLRRLYTINPASVYRKAMYELNTNPAILEIMGAPVTGSSVRATVLRGGGLSLKGLVPRIRSRKVQMIFPLTGSERRGLVSLEAKKQRYFFYGILPWQDAMEKGMSSLPCQEIQLRELEGLCSCEGRYLFKLLAVDAPTQDGKEQRIFVEGDQKAYDRGGVINELRDPFLRAISLKETDEAEDDLDDAVDEAAEAQKKREKQAAKLKASPKPMDQGGGMYFYERVYWGLKNTIVGGSQDASAKINQKTPLSPTSAKDKITNLSGDAQSIADKAERLNVASDPEPPIDTETDRVHQFKKEASAQQAP